MSPKDSWGFCGIAGKAIRTGGEGFIGTGEKNVCVNVCVARRNVFSFPGRVSMMQQFKPFRLILPSYTNIASLQ